MTTSRFSFLPSTVVAFATAAALASAALVACNDAGASSERSEKGAAGDFDDPSADSEGTTFGSSDAAAPPASLYRGSPLCRVTAERCMPDDDGLKRTLGVEACASAPDAGGATKGCRIAKASGADVGPACGEAAEQGGGDGAACEKGKDCAPGFDCVEGEAGGVCRRYCCAGTCKGETSQNGGPTFCDIQKLVDVNPAKAPVCMPLKSCKLLTQGQCEDDETCAVVNEEGETGCVANGAARVGESCEGEHCNVGLTCLGQPGSRACYQLCRTDGPSACGLTQVCKTSTLFKEGVFGVCKDVSTATP